MAIRSWSDFDITLALMMPGEAALDPLERRQRNDRPVDLDPGDGVKGNLTRPGPQVTLADGRRARCCAACGRPSKVGAVQLKGGLCGRCRAA